VSPSTRGGAVFAVRVQIAGRIRVSRYKLTKYLVLSHVAETSNGHLSSVAIQTSTKPGLSQGTQVLLGADAGIRVYIVLLICQDSKSTCLPASRICKNRENFPFHGTSHSAQRETYLFYCPC